MATQPMNVETTFNGAQSIGPVRGTILDQWLSAHEKWAPLTLRVPLGVIFFAHGAQKLLGWFGGYGWHGTMQYMTQSLHIPAPLAAIAILVEFLGGLALLAGALTRWAALLTAVEMLVAAVIVHLPNGFFLNWANDPNKGHGIEYNVALIGAALALMLMGGGRFSVDEQIKS
jgi:putative oxidoreductase